LFVFLFFAGLLLFSRLAHAAPTVPDPTDHPIEFWSTLADLRTSGGLYVVIAVAIAAIAKSLARVLAPAGGGAATGLRGRVISTLTAVALVAGALVDMLIGSLTGTGLAVAAAGAAAMIQDPRDTPPKRSSTAAAAGVTTAMVFMLTLLALLALTSCSKLQLRDRAANGVRVGLDCTTPALVATAQEGAELARAAILATIRDDGRPDTSSLRDAGRALRKESLRCTFIAALAALAAPVPRPSSSEEPPQALGLEVDGRALRAAGRDLAATYWGVRGSILLPGGGSLDPNDDPDAGGQ
jgi:hypothetical protein